MVSDKKLPIEEPFNYMSNLKIFLKTGPKLKTMKKAMKKTWYVIAHWILNFDLFSKFYQSFKKKERKEKQR